MNVNKNECLISIFMPVYNGSKYLKESIESVLKQTFNDFELVCVDDSSTDNSYQILIEFSKLDSRVKVYQKPNGGIVPKSWNYILPFLKGENIIYMSQDDFLSIDVLEEMIGKQQETDADCVLPDMVYFYENRQENKILSGVNGNRDIILTNREAVILSLNWQIHGFALWKSKIFENVHFHEDSFNSDEFETRKLFFKCNKIAFSNGVFYYRNDNPTAITKTFNLNTYFGLLTSFRLCEFLRENNFNSKETNDYHFSFYREYFNLYRYYSLKSGINTEDELLYVRQLLKEIFDLMGKSKLFNISIWHEEITLHKKVKRLIISRIVFLLFSNHLIFRLIMYFIYLRDKSRVLQITKDVNKVRNCDKSNL